MNVFFVCNWFPNRNNPTEGFFLTHYAEAISNYDQITIFFAEEDTQIKNPKEEIEKQEKNVRIKMIYYKPFASRFKFLNLSVSSLKRLIYLHLLIRREFEVNRPDVFHFNIVSPSVLNLWYYKLFYGIPFVYSEHWDIPLRARMGLIKNWLPWRIGMKLSSLFASRVIVCSAAMKESFNHYKLSDRVEIISSVVLLDNSGIQNEYPIQRKKIILHVSSLSDKQKNVSGMIKGVAKLYAKRSDFEFHILGYGKEFNEHNALAEKLNVLNKAIYFHGFVPNEEKVQWFNKSSFHVIFSNFEGYSLVTAESIYYGRPVIATKCGGPEDFVNQKTGVLIKPGNENELIQAIEYMLDNYQKFDPVILKKYGEEIFSPRVVGLKHHELYLKIKST